MALGEGFDEPGVLGCLAAPQLVLGVEGRSEPLQRSVYRRVVAVPGEHRTKLIELLSRPTRRHNSHA